jgi:uncharacterized protein YbaR (Trm112 family)
MAARSRPEVISFKVDEALSVALQGIPNRSEFIRSAVLAALANVCPLCKGRGRLTVDQRRHWDSFASSHRLAPCEQCHALHLVCENEEGGGVHRAPRRRR